MRLAWDKTGERLYETGVDKGVLYPFSKESEKYAAGVPWNGLSAVNESPSGAEPTALYANNAKYVTLMSAEELGLTIEAYTYPDEFLKCLGKEELAPGVTISQQDREHFGVSYRTLIGNDEQGNNHGYKIHLVYDCLASPTEDKHSTVNDSPDVSPFSWEVSTTPVSIDDAKTTTKITIDSTVFHGAEMMNAFRAIEDALYGTDKTEAWLPVFSELEELIYYHRCLIDSKSEALLDSSGKPLLSRIYE